jgi:hypothetical protein
MIDQVTKRQGWLIDQWMSLNGNRHDWYLVCDRVTVSLKYRSTIDWWMWCYLSMSWGVRLSTLCVTNQSTGTWCVWYFCWSAASESGHLQLSAASRFTCHVTASDYIDIYHWGTMSRLGQMRLIKLHVLHCSIVEIVLHCCNLECIVQDIQFTVINRFDTQSAMEMQLVVTNGRGHYATHLIHFRACGSCGQVTDWSDVCSALVGWTTNNVELATHQRA